MRKIIPPPSSSNSVLQKKLKSSQFFFFLVQLTGVQKNPLFFFSNSFGHKFAIEILPLKKIK